MTELNVLLKLLDHETLSCATEEKKTAVKNLLRQLQPSGIYKISFSNGYYLVQAGFSGWTTSRLTLKATDVQSCFWKATFLLSLGFMQEKSSLL